MLPAGRITMAVRRYKLITCAVLVVLLFLLPVFGVSEYFLSICILAMIYTTATASLRLVALTGQINMGHAGFMMTGAYVSAVLAKEVGLSPGVAIVVGGLSAFIIGFLVGLPFARVRGLYFSMITLFFGAGLLSINQVLTEYTGGYSGLAGIPPLLSTNAKGPYYFLFLGITISCLAIIYRLEFSRIGMTWKTIAQSDLVASSVGINVQLHKAISLGLGAFIVGIAGATFAHYYTILSHSSFNFLASLYLIVYMLTGGIGSFAGPIVGAALLVIIPESLRSLKEYVPYVFAGIMLFVVFLMPNGIAGLPNQIRQSLQNKGTVGVKREVPEDASRG